ncbi:MAG: hypothetical protein KDA58_14585 [Planctomycetaceae bacterium]|nr:hypothetical protein [Planctomycetaceae bacterium]
MSSPPSSQSAPHRHHTAAGIDVELVPFAQLGNAQFDAWLDLERHALDGNPFCSLHHVRAAALHLRSATPPQVLLIWSGSQLLGLSVLEATLSTKYLPLPHLRLWSTEHTFLDGLLLRRNQAYTASDALWDFLMRGRHPWHGMEFSQAPVDSPTFAALFATADEWNVPVWKGPKYERASLIPRTAGPNRLVTSTSIGRARSLRKGHRQLEKFGEVRFEIIDSGQDLGTATNELLRLEALGWKSDCGTALSASEHGDSYFRVTTRKKKGH